MAAEAEKNSNFFLGFLFLPKKKREALSAVYAYCRLIDDIVDDPILPKQDALAQLGFWREEIERLFRGAPTHPVAEALLRPIADYGIPREAFEEMIRGCAMDLDAAPYRSPEDLESYMRGVASSVGIMCVHIFGWRATPPEKMREFAVVFGYAFQLTNIMRDVGADLELGRVYIPESDLLAASYPRERLLRREHDAAFDRLMESLYWRAKDYYARARAFVDPADRPSLFPAEVMGHVYEGLLDAVRAEGYPVLSRTVRLSRRRKLALTLKAWWYCYGR